MDTIKDLIAQEQLLPAFEQKVLPNYEALAIYLSNKHDAKRSALLVAVNGAPGTGKSTMAIFLRALLHKLGKQLVAISMDDLYHTYQARKKLAKTVHPLLITRGVPGTHDLTLGQLVIRRLQHANAGDIVEIPAYDKAADDRKPQSQWSLVTGAVDIILLEGWCVGATPMPEAGLHQPINQLEAEEDAGAVWRTYVNQQLKESYQDFFKQFDLLVMLMAPDYDCVKAWRALQEVKLSARIMQSDLDGQGANESGQTYTSFKGLMDGNALDRFMMHYERLTLHMFEEMPQRADALISLNPDHAIQSVVYRG